MAQTRIKRVVYPRPDFTDNNVGWIFSQIPAFSPSINVAVVPSSFVTSKRKTLDVRRDITEHSGWISEFAMKPRYAVPGESQNNLGFIQPSRKKLHVNVHAPWIDDGAYRFQQIPVSTYTPSLYPAIAFQSTSFRAQRRLRYRPVRSGAPRESFNSAISPAFEQLIHSYRMLAQNKYRSMYHDWQDDQAAIFANAPLPSFDPSLWASAGVYNYRMPSRDKRFNSLLWDTLSRTAAGFQDGVEIFAGTFNLQAESFRVDERKRSKIFERWLADQDGWTSYIEVVFNVTAQSSAREQLMQDVRVQNKFRYRPDMMDWNDLGAWMFVPTAFDGTLFPSINALNQVYRQGDRRKLDVRQLDMPHDQWISYNPTIELPLWAGAFQSSTEAFITQKRKQTLDILRVEDFHDFAWLRAVLDLTDAPFGIPVAHWRHIEGAIRSRRRRRRGR